MLVRVPDAPRTKQVNPDIVRFFCFDRPNEVSNMYIYCALAAFDVYQRRFQGEG